MARSLGLQLHILNASTAPEIDAAFAGLVEQRIGMLLSAADPFFMGRRDQVVALAGRHAVSPRLLVLGVRAAGSSAARLRLSALVATTAKAARVRISVPSSSKNSPGPASSESKADWN
jgi:hypothetical protein